MNTITPFYIFSFENESNSNAENEVNREFTLSVLNANNVPYKHIKGFYKGIPENSLLVPSLGNESIILKTAFGFLEQESVLHVDANGLGQLIFKDDKTLEVGKFTMIDKSYIEKIDNYSIIDGHFFTTL